MLKKMNWCSTYFFQVLKSLLAMLALLEQMSIGQSLTVMKEMVCSSHLIIKNV